MIEKYKIDKTFVLCKTLECGQCFHYINEDGYYIVLGHNEIAKVWQDDKYLYIEAENQSYWVEYFALDIDYSQICTQLRYFAVRNKDNFMKEAVEQGKGIRLLRQPFFETACSFILSQRNNIPRIRKMIFTLSERFSSCRCKINNKEYACFPSVEDLSKVSIDELKSCGLGYRAEYLYEFVRNWKEILDRVKFDYNLDFQLFKAQKGIGDKVANCICLYGFGEYDAFPIDVWMQKIIDKYYDGELENLKIPKENAGILQQFMFYYERSLNKKISI